ncbi:MAG TPA: ankyrin repeat domain-containing protein [Kofleriaceae bacterium]|nr:ankyrin repeat domain-containing protein [Kofleriaceae bacterium]
MRWVVVLVLMLASVAQAQPKTNVDAVDSDGWTALMRAAQGGKTVEVANLLDRGANIEASNPKVYDGATPLVLALEYGQDDTAKLLLDRGASVAGKLGTSALVLAARGGFDDIVDRLVTAKVSPKGTLALQAAARYGHVSTIKRLVKAGAVVRDKDTGDHDYTPFIVACQENQLAAARALLDAGANVNDVDADGTPALHWAVFGERPDEVHEYREMGKPHDTYWIPHKDAPLVKLLLGKGAKREAVDADGNTALHKAAMLDVAAAAKVLLAAGANRAKKNAEGQTAYELAKDRKNSVEPILRPKKQ